MDLVFVFVVTSANKCRGKTLKTVVKAEGKKKDRQIVVNKLTVAFCS